MSVVRMPGPFGAVVDGFNIDLLGESADELATALYEHKVLVVRDQHLEDEDYARFGRSFGEPIVFFAPDHRDRANPELIRVTNSARTPAALRDGARHWHSDSSYEAVPAFITMLYALEVPPSGNDTMFADTAAAYEALPRDVKDRIDDLRVVHDPRGGRVPLLEGEVRGDSTSSTLPIVEHPLVTRHPVTGQRALFGFSGTAIGIVDWGEDEALALLLSLKEHAVQERFRQNARAEPDSILMWDNFSVVHSATPMSYSDEDGQRRRLLRISTRYAGPREHSVHDAPSKDRR
jgi:taurine dioxygenase